jgi:hypothetical protein
MNKKKAIMPVLALMLCVGAFLFPATAYAASPTDTTPPTLTAKLSGETLLVQASDDLSGVEAVIIDGNRLNYLVDGIANVKLKDYAGTGENVTIYAIDFASNKSKAVIIKNPYYTAPGAAPAPVVTTPLPPAITPTAEPAVPSEPEIPAEVPSDPKPLTPDGTGTVLDNPTGADGKEFFTIQTADESVFYLIIDRQRDNENVYFLNAVTVEDLIPLAQGTAAPAEPNPGAAVVQDPSVSPSPSDPDPDVTPEPDIPAEPAGGVSTGTIIFILIAVVVAGGAGYYFKILKPKKLAAQNDDEDEEEPDFFEEEQPDTATDEDEYFFEDEPDKTDSAGENE